MIEKLINLARPEIINMQAYRSARSEQMQGDIWMDANENPWDVTNEQYNRYPEPQPNILVQRLSTLYGVNTDQLLVTRGSDEGIDLLVRTFCRAGIDKVMICPPTYGMYQIASQIQNAQVVSVPLIKDNDFALDPLKIIEKWQPEIKIIFLCSPNNPTGNNLKKEDILSVCAALNGKAIVVADEAYIEFSKEESLSKQLQQYSNLVVLRTLSKAYGLAGIRCGTTLADPLIIQLLKKVIAPYPLSKSILNVVSQKLTAENLEKTSEQISIVNAEKLRLTAFLKALPFVKKVWNSDANFILFEVTDAQKTMQHCQKNGIVLRNRSHEHQLNNCIRISIAKPSENKMLMETLKNV